jgi:hypothetical protein
MLPKLRKANKRKLLEFEDGTRKQLADSGPEFLAFLEFASKFDNEEGASESELIRKR